MPPDWEDLDAHRAPEWFRDAKLGVFVHYSPTWFEDRPVPTGFDADAIAGAAADAGAEYLVVTTKHHDGYCNWPSEHTDFGADEPHGPRDVISPLADAVRRRGLRLGFYYSWLDDHHPDYPDRDAYVRDYAHAQLTELQERYRPAILWGDGEWDHPAEHWGARDLLTDYYRRAAAWDREVAVNDRLGSDARYYYAHGLADGDFEPGDPHGDYWTPEHQVPAAPMGHAWEVCETMHDGWSHEPDPNWRAPEDLLALFCYAVGHGGNLLLNVGPGPDGRLADREREVLARFGAWLATNGEAVRGTRPLADPGADVPFVPEVDWEDPAETWARLVEYVRAAGPFLVRRARDAYALVVGSPATLRVPLPARAGAEVTLLGEGELDWERDGAETVVELPGDGADTPRAVRVPLSLQVEVE